MTEQAVDKPRVFPQAALRVSSGTGALLVVETLSLAARLFFVGTNALSYDESHILTFATLVEQGHIPYREVFIGIPPLAVLSVQWGIRLFGYAPWVRLPLVLQGVLGVAVLFVLVRRHAPVHPVAAATLAALFFSFNPRYFAVSNTLNLEAAALCYGLLAVWAMDNYHYGGVPSSRWRAVWLAVSGACFTLSLALKILLPFLPGVILVQMLLAVHQTKPDARWQVKLWELIRIGSIWLLGFLFVLGLFALAYDPILMYRQVVDFRLELQTVVSTVADDTEVNVAQALTWMDLTQFAPLAAAAVAGLILLWRKRTSALWLWGAWLTLGLLFLVIHIPMRPRHLVIPLPALAALSGIGLVAGWQQWRNGTVRTMLTAATLLTLIAYPVIGSQAARIPEFTVRHQSAREHLIDYIQATTSPHDCVVSKENRLYFLTGRFPPPFLSEVSTSRLFSHMLTTAGVIRELDRQDCAMLVYAKSYDELAPGLHEQASALYSLRLAVNGAKKEEPIELFSVPLDTQKPPATALPANLGDQIQFTGFDLTSGPWTHGQTVYLSTYWHTRQAPPSDYRMFVHLVDSQGKLAQAADHFPFELNPAYNLGHIDLNPLYLTAQQGKLPANYPNDGLIPTHLWRPGTTLKETIRFALAPDVLPGRYTLRVGFFDPVTGTRLEVNDDVPGGTDNEIVLATVDVR